MADVTKVTLGVCSVVFNNVDLGHTIGGVTVSYEPIYHDRVVDKYGATIVDKILMGEKLTAKVPLAETTLANLQIAIPEGTTSGDKLTLGSSVGDALSDEAKVLVLHPIANEASNRDDDVVIHKAVSSGPIEIAFKNDGEKIYEVEFMALLDETKTDGNYLGFIGDSV